MRTINVHIVNDLGADSIGGSVADVPNAWPGVATDIDITDPPEIRAIWIGVSADGSDNQIFPPTATPAQIIAAGWPRVYQGTELFYVDGSVVVVTEPIKTMQILLASCCATQVQTVALVLKQSPYTLRPLLDGGTPPPCGADAIFTLLAIKGTNENRTMGLDIYVQPYSADGNVGLNYHLILPFDINGLVPFTETVSISKKWPDDFIDWVDDNGFKIVGNDVVPGPNEYKVSTFDNGGITLICVIYEIVSPEQFVIISNALADFWLPATDCD